MSIAIYSRKSKFTGKGESIENQILKCKQFIQFKFSSDEDVEIFVDEGFTGKNENRPKYQEMMRKVREGKIKHIVLYQLNRFGRNSRDIHNSLQECIDNDCVIYSAQEGFDSKTSFGRAIIGIMASLAQLETEQLAERIKDNMYTLAKHGRWLGGNAPTGYVGVRELYIDESGRERSLTKLSPNKDELKTVKKIYEKYIEEQSLSQVEKWALQNCMCGQKGKLLEKSTIRFILHNPVYVKSNQEVCDYLTKKGYEVCGIPNGNGIIKYGKDPVVAAVSNHKGIIDASIWLRVQEILDENSKKAPRMGKTNIALLTGILKCSCGSSMGVIQGKINPKTGKKHFYYSCRLKIRSGGKLCSSKNIKGDVFEEKLINYLKQYNKDTLIKELKLIIEESNSSNKKNDISTIKLEIEKHNKSIKRLLEKLKLTDDEDISDIILTEIKNEKNSIKTLNEKIEEFNEEEAVVLLSDSELLQIYNSLEDFVTSFDNLSIDDKQKALRSLIDSIQFNGDEFIINFNLKKKLDEFIYELSSYNFYSKRLLFRLNSFCELLKKAIKFNDLFYDDMPEETLSDRFKKAVMYAGMSRTKLSNLLGISESVLGDYSSGHQTVISKSTLDKLITVLDRNILCDDYLNFLLNQSEEVSKLLEKYGPTKLQELTGIHSATFYKWKFNKGNIRIKNYNKLKDLL